MYNKAIIRFGFCDIQNNQGRGRGYQLKLKAEADNPYQDLDYSGYHKTPSNNCLLLDEGLLKVIFKGKLFWRVLECLIVNFIQRNVCFEKKNFVNLHLPL